MPQEVKLLSIAFHFPPVSGSSGFLRALKFAGYLQSSTHVRPHVLTIKPFAYEQTAEANNELLRNTGIAVTRATGFDASRHFAIKGKYFGFMTLPDKWSSWIPFAFIKGLLLHRKEKFDAIMVTFPISSSLVIGNYLSKWTGLPLIVDLRDPVWEEETWQNTPRQKLLKRIESDLIARARRVIFTSPGTLEKYRARYPDAIANKASVIPNGYDETDFEGLSAHCVKNGKKVFLHSGLLPEYERNPEAFFVAVSRMKQKGTVDAERVEFRLRASGHDAIYLNRLIELDIQDLVTFAPPIPYKQALQEMLGADGLMIFQDSTCNWQIPAKLFEYFRAGKPVLAFTDTDSDTANLLNAHSGNHVVAPLSSHEAIESAIEQFLARDDFKGTFDNTERYTREALSVELADVITSAVKRN